MRVPLDQNAVDPADDLIYQNESISPFDAIVLRNSGVDLSTLNPQNKDYFLLPSASDVAAQGILEASVSLSDTLDKVTYRSSLKSFEIYRANVFNEESNRVFIFDKNLHTWLLRRNLLTALGYVLPKVIYHRKVEIHFNSLEDKKELFEKLVLESKGAIERWLIEDKGLHIVVKDIASVSDLSTRDYDLSMGINTLDLNSRVTRAQALIYHLSYFPESSEEATCSNARIENQNIVLKLNQNIPFQNISLDDLKWAQKKINLLSQAGLEMIVKKAYFPPAVEIINIEKLKANIVQLNRLLSLKSKNEFKYNCRLNDSEKGIVDGKLKPQEFKDYASNFYLPNEKSLLDQIWYYVLGRGQSDLIFNAIAKYFNSKLVGFDLGSARLDYYEKLFKKGLDHFVKTGEFLPIKIDSWESPLFNLKLILSRDFVIGEFMGTNNLLQLADTVGIGVDLGYVRGFEGMTNANMINTAKLTVVHTLTHLKPLKSIKAGFQEKYQNIFVPLLKSRLKDMSASLARITKDQVELEQQYKQDFANLKKKYLKNLNEEDYLIALQIINKEETAKVDQLNPMQRKMFDEALQLKNIYQSSKLQMTKEKGEDLKILSEYLSVGESLIISTQRVPSLNFDLRFLQDQISSSLNLSAGHQYIDRLHVYRKDANTIQVFRDIGKKWTLDLSSGAFINALRPAQLSLASEKGKYHVRVYTINIETETEKNPKLANNMELINQILSKNDFSLYGRSPLEVKGYFKDFSARLGLLMFRSMFIKDRGEIEVSSNNLNGKVFYVQQDRTRGLNAESFILNILSDLLGRKVDPNLAISDPNFKNPGLTFFGRSENFNGRIEALDENGVLSEPYLSIRASEQGWSVKRSQLIEKVKSINDQYGTVLFEDDFSFKSMKLFKVEHEIRLYESAILNLTKLKNDKIEMIEKKYSVSRYCDRMNLNRQNAKCGNLRMIKYLVDKKKDSLTRENLKTILELALQLKEDLDFSDFESIVGKENFLLFGSINGQREKTSRYSEAIYSHSLGSVSGRFPRGPLQFLQDLIQINEGELQGRWIKDGIN